MKYPREKLRTDAAFKAATFKTAAFKTTPRRIKYTVKSLPSDFYLEQCAKCVKFLPRGGMLFFVAALRHPLARLQ